MPIVSMRQLLDHAAENGYGLPAFNVNNMEQVWAIMEAAAEVDAPVIMQAVSYTHLDVYKRQQLECAPHGLRCGFPRTGR